MNSKDLINSIQSPYITLYQDGEGAPILVTHKKKCVICEREDAESYFIAIDRNLEVAVECVNCLSDRDLIDTLGVVAI